MGPNPNRPRSGSCDRAIRYSGLGVRSVGPTVGDFLDFNIKFDLFPPISHWMIFEKSTNKNPPKNGTYLVVDGGSYPTIYIDQRVFPCYMDSCEQHELNPDITFHGILVLFYTDPYNAS